MLRRLLLGLLFAGIALMTTAAAAQARKPNIIFILADDLGYGDLGCYGQKQIQTPNLDRMAKEGRRFTQFYAGSTVCAPSRCALMTGRHIGHALIRGNAKQNLGPADLTIAEILKGSGYRTGLFGKWGLGHEGSTGTPNRKGFDEFFGYLDQTHAHNYWPTFLHRNETRVPLRNVVPNEGPVGQGVATVKVDYSHDLIAGEALKFVESNKDRPFFLYLAVTLPHANNEGRDRGIEVPDLDQYGSRDWPENEKLFASSVARLDRDIGRVRERLRALNLDSNTLILFTSDNGPHREGGHNPDFFDSNGPLRGIKRDLYEGGIRVPMLAVWPGKIPTGSQSDHQGAFWDVMPTLAEVAGAPKPQSDGISFLPSLTGKPSEQKPHEFLYGEFYEGRSSRAIRSGNWKAVCTPANGPVQLFDLATDLSETKDVAAGHPDVVRRLTMLMDREHTPSDRWKLPGER